jgi:hypothetical protein
MTTFGDMVYQFGGVPVSALDPVMLAGGKWYFFDPTHGHADGDGSSPEEASSDLVAMEDQLRDGYNDGILFKAGATAWAPTAALDWDKSYTHLIGTCGLPGQGNRCRLVAPLASALSCPFTFSGSGCVVKNLQLNNDYATGAIGVAALDGERNLFENVFIMPPSSVTAASYSLKIGGGENTFNRCTIGQTTKMRTGASRNVWFHVGDGDCQRNKFISSEFLSWSSATTHVLIYTDVDIDVEGFSIQFENCLFHNLNGSGEAGGVLAVAIDDNCAVHHQILLRGQGNCFAGVTAVAAPLTYVLKAETGTGTQSGLLMATVNES